MPYDTPNRSRNAVMQMPRLIEMRKRLTSAHPTSTRYGRKDAQRRGALKGLRSALGARSK